MKATKPVLAGLDFRADLPEMIRRCAPMARECVMVGLMPLADDSTEARELETRLWRLVGHEGLVAGQESPEAFERSFEYASAAFSLGLACGLLLHPAAFEKGGAR